MNGILDDLDFWTRDEMEENCTLLGTIGESDEPPDSYDYFVRVPHEQYRVSNAELADYRLAADHEIGAFVVRVGTSGSRDVLLAFNNEEDRDALLETPGIIAPR